MYINIYTYSLYKALVLQISTAVCSTGDVLFIQLSRERMRDERMQPLYQAIYCTHIHTALIHTQQSVQYIFYIGLSFSPLFKEQYMQMCRSRLPVWGQISREAAHHISATGSDTSYKRGGKNRQWRGWNKGGESEVCFINQWHSLMDLIRAETPLKSWWVLAAVCVWVWSVRLYTCECFNYL